MHGCPGRRQSCSRDTSSCLLTCWGDWNSHPPLRGSRGAAEQTQVLCLPLLQSQHQQTPQRHSCRQHPSPLALQTCSSGSFPKARAPSDSCLQIPLQSTGQEAQPMPSEPPLPCCCWKSQQPEKSPNPLSAITLEPCADKTLM